MTVSLALRNDPRLRAETRLRIQAIARELGYRPDPHLAIHMERVRSRKPLRRTATLGFITAFPTRNECLKVPVFRDYYLGACARCDQLGYRLEEFWAKEPGMTGRRLSQILRVRGITGLLIAPVPASYGHLSLDWSQFSAATFGYSLRKPNLPRAMSDMFQAVTEVLRRLRRLGYQRIGLAIPNFSLSRTNSVAIAALWLYQRALPASRRVPPLSPAIWDDDHIIAWVRKERPDVIVGHAAGYVRLLRQHGYRVPQDIGFANLHWFHGDACSGMDPNFKLIGAAGADLVVSQLHLNETGVPSHPRAILISSTWVEGDTVCSQNYRRAGKERRTP